MSVYQSARLFISSQYESLLFEIWLMMVVISILYNRILSMSAIAVMGVQCEPEVGEHTALGGSSVKF